MHCLLLFENQATEWLDVSRVRNHLSERYDIPAPLLAAILDDLERDGLLDGIYIQEKWYRYQPPDQRSVLAENCGEGLE